MEGIHISLAAEKLGELWGIPITNTLVMTWAVVALLVVFALVSSRTLKLLPGRFQTGLEMVVGGGFEYVSKAIGDVKLAHFYFPLIASFFVFIVTSNLLEFIPGVGSIGFFRLEDGSVAFLPLFRSANTDLNTTLALTIIAFLTIELSGFLRLGFLNYSAKFVNFKAGVVGFLVGIVEIIGNLARLISLSFRLFGNILAGEVLLGVIGFFAPWIIPVPFLGFEIFIGFLQAAIFALLTLAFIKIAIMEAH